MSGITNQELIQKAVVTTTDLASAGKLSPKQSDKFIDFVIDVTMLRNNVRVVRFTNETMQIDKIGVHQRVTMPKAEARAPSARRGITTSKVELTPKDQITPFEISDNFPDQCIEGERVEDTITRLMATQTANDLEELCINGDTRGPARLESDLVEGGSDTQVVKDTFIAQFDGWLKLANSANVWDAEGADVSSTVFSRMLNAMPTKFRRVRQNLRFLCSLDHEQLYRERVGSRQTPAGDAASTSLSSLTPFGVPLVAVPLLESEPRVTANVTLGAHPDTKSLGFAPIGTVHYVTTQTLGTTPTTPYIDTTDYTIDHTLGTISTAGGGALAGGGSVKVTFHTAGQILLTDQMNLILAVGRDIRIERDRDIYKGVNQFAITTRISVNIEELTAIVKGINIGLT